MERPILDPSFAPGDDQPPAKPPRPGLVWRAARRAWGTLVWEIHVIRRRGPRAMKIGTPAGRWLHGLLYRLALMPAVVILAMILLVAVATHPQRLAGASDPQSIGVYYDPVTFLSSDGTRIDGWLVPQVDAGLVLTQREAALGKRPAVILVHDFGYARGQMLPLIKPLHDAGFVVLAISLRGCGTSGPGASTFGLNEARDVIGAAEMLRRRSYVDADRIGVIGLGTGATAATMAAHDGQIQAIVLDHPLPDCDRALAEYVGPKPAWLQWTRPVCRWAFEVACRVDADELDTASRPERLSGCAVLLFDEHSAARNAFTREGTQQTIDFLRAKLSPPEAEEPKADVEEVGGK